MIDRDYRSVPLTMHARVRRVGSFGERFVSPGSERYRTITTVPLAQQWKSDCDWRDGAEWEGQMQLVAERIFRLRTPFARMVVPAATRRRVTLLAHPLADAAAAARSRSAVKNAARLCILALLCTALLWPAQLALADFRQQAPKLFGTGAVGAAQQGRSVAVSADGNTAIVGGPNDNSNFGAAWVFTRSGSVWSQQGRQAVRHRRD